MANQAKSNPSSSSSSSANQQSGDPLFNLHHAQAEAALQQQDPTALTLAGKSANQSLPDSEDETGSGPIDSQGQRRGQQPSTPEMGSTAGHH